MILRLCFLSALLLASVEFETVIARAKAAEAMPPDVVVFCEPTLRHPIEDVGALWRRRTGVPVRVFSAPTPLLLEEISHGPRSDLIVGEGDELAARATERQLVKAEPNGHLWRNRLVLARRGPAPVAESAVPVLAATSDLLAMAEAKPVALVDPPVAATGVRTRQALQSLGLWDGMQGHSIGVVGTDDAIFLLVDGTARLALIHATDVAAHPALSVAATLPDESYTPITYWIAETASLQSPEASKFEAFLRTPDAQEILRADGLEVLQ